MPPSLTFLLNRFTDVDPDVSAWAWVWCGWKSRITRPPDIFGSEVSTAEARPEATPASTATARAADPIFAKVRRFMTCP